MICDIIVGIVCIAAGFVVGMVVVLLQKEGDEDD